MAEQERNSATLADTRQKDKALGKFYKTSLKSAFKFKGMT